MQLMSRTLIWGASKMGSLKRLELHACEGVSGDGVLKYAEGRNQGFELLIDACPGVRSKDLKKLTKIVKSTLNGWAYFLLFFFVLLLLIFPLFTLSRTHPFTPKIFYLLLSKLLTAFLASQA